MDIENWQSQLRKGSIELAVLSLLEARSRYGLDILESIQASGLELREGTLYPLLHRLHKEKKLAAEWVSDKDASHPRKYYGLTKEGKVLLKAMKQSWLEYASTMNRLLEDTRVR